MLGLLAGMEKESTSTLTFVATLCSSFRKFGKWSNGDPNRENELLITSSTAYNAMIEIRGFKSHPFKSFVPAGAAPRHSPLVAYVTYFLPKKWPRF